MLLTAVTMIYDPPDNTDGYAFELAPQPRATDDDGVDYDGSKRGCAACGRRFNHHEGRMARNEGGVVSFRHKECP